MLNTNSKERETSRIIDSENSTQTSRKLKQMRFDLNLQIYNTLNSTITEKVLPSF